MARGNLTRRVVDAAEPRATRYTLFDAGDKAVKGFGLRVFPSGQKSWIFEYRPADGGRRSDKRRITLGSTADLTPEEARKLADKHRSLVKTGGDPALEKAKRREAVTVEELATASSRIMSRPNARAGPISIMPTFSIAS